MKYLIGSTYLWDGKYMMSPCSHWHERIRIKLAKWLFESVKKPNKLIIKTYTS